MIDLLSGYAIFSLSTVLIFVALATLLHLQFGLAGVVNFGVVGFWGLGMYAFGILLLQFQVPYIWALVLAVLIVAVVAFILGWVILELDSQAQLVATLAFAAVISDLVTTEKWLTKGVVGLGTVPHPFGGSQSALWLLLILLVLTAIVILYSWLLGRSPYGRLLAAIRDNEVLARGLGKNTTRTKLVFFTLTSAVMGLFGALSAPVRQFLTPDLLGPGLTFSVWIALIVGGKRWPLGGLIGVLLTIFIFDFVIETYLKVPATWAQTIPILKLMLYGITLVLVLLFRPFGLLGDRRKPTTHV
jgi:branched-chain amino acid transport system permease protein